MVELRIPGRRIPWKWQWCRQARSLLFAAGVFGVAAGVLPAQEDAQAQEDTQGLEDAQAQEKTPGGIPLLQLVDIQGERKNQLTGIGLVTGLAGSGDSPKDPLLRQALERFTGHFGLEVTPEEIKSKNCAVVSLTLELPPYVREGQAQTVQLSALGDAQSLKGGVLIQAPLRSSRGETYAAAQGRVVVGREEGGETTGKIPGGAVMEKSVVSTVDQGGRIGLLLKNPGYPDAEAVAEVLRGKWGGDAVQVEDASLVTLQIPDETQAPKILAELAGLRAEPSRSSKVVVDSRAGVVVMGSQVRIAPVAVSCRGVQIQVGEGRFSSSVSEAFLMDGNADVKGLVQILQELKLGTDTVVEVLRNIEEAGALYGELIIR